MIIIGIDIGGNEIKFVLKEKQEIIKKFKIKTVNTQDNIISVIQQKVEQIKQEFSSSEIKGIGIAVAGIVSSGIIKQENLIFEAPNLPFLSNFDLAKTVSQQTGLKAIIENDANCFTLAESVLGIAKKAKIVVGITLGTGIGGGIVQKRYKGKKIDYEIYRGAFGAAGEIGHIKVKLDGNQCSCGGYGCLEEYASEKFIKRKTGCFGIELTKRANQGDEKAIKIYQELGKNLGYGLGIIINILDPEIIVIGGGLINAADLFLETAIQEAKRAAFFSSEKVEILKAGLGIYAGAIGASLLFEI